MVNFSAVTGLQGPLGRLPAALLHCLLLALLFGLPSQARAQAPAWAAALAPTQTSASGTANTRATAVNTAGDVLLTGSFTGTVSFGATTLLSAGNSDVFVAKWNTAAGTWAWAVAGGGGGSDYGSGIATSGSSVYITGTVYSTSNVQFGGTPLAGVNATAGYDVVVAKYTDAGTSATYGWAVAGGGAGYDIGNGIALSGSSVYVTGYATNNLANANGVQFGGVALPGASTTVSYDVFVAKYTDVGTSATYGWAVAGGGDSGDVGNGIAVSGSSVYVTGSVYGEATNAGGVQFGGKPLPGASTSYSTDVFVAKYTDVGTSATYGWAVAGGGTNTDIGYGIAASGSSVYVTGVFYGGGQFGGKALPSASSLASQDAFVAKYTDAGSSATYGWAVAGGGRGADYGTSIAASSGNVYITGTVDNTSGAQFGGVVLAGAGLLSSQEVFVTKYSDAGSAATYGWAAVGGGSGADAGYGIALSGSSVQVGCYTGTATARFGQAAPVAANAAGRAALDPATGAWQNTGTATTGGGISYARATAVNAAGDVLLTGSFTGQVTFGNTTLTSAGAGDVFVAKWNTAAGTWAWAVAGGGNNGDQGNGIAVSGSSVYVTGFVTNSSANAYGVQFGGVAVPGASATASQDVFVAKYTDAGTSATYGWAVAGGGTNSDGAYGIAASGSSVYVTGFIQNTTGNASGVLFGGVAVPGASATAGQDVFIAKYTDAGGSATYGWAVTGGGTNSDYGYGVAVSGSSVYVTGYLINSSANANAVQFGGVALPGASATTNADVFVAKYTDAGTSATYGWAVTGGGTSYDYGYGIAVSGSNVYVTGNVYNSSANANAVQFGGVALPGATTTASTDVFVVKYRDAGSAPALGWAVTGGGTDYDYGQGIAVSGSNVYVTGYFVNNSANANGVQFGGVALPGASATMGYDVFAARYTDAGNSATSGWAVAGGGPDTDIGNGIAVSGTSVYVAGFVTSAATFGSTTLSPSGQAAFGARLIDTNAPVLASAAPAGSPVGLRLYPNPTAGPALLTGAVPGAAVQVLDALGRRVAATQADATGTARVALPAGLPAGVYVVRAGPQAARLVVE